MLRGRGEGVGDGKEGRGLGNMGSWSPQGGALQGRAHHLLAETWRPGGEGNHRGCSQGAFRDPQWVLQGALEEESAGSPCAIGRQEKGEDVLTGLMGVNPYAAVSLERSRTMAGGSGASEAGSPALGQGRDEDRRRGHWPQGTGSQQARTSRLPLSSFEVMSGKEGRTWVTVGQGGGLQREGCEL